MARLSAWYWPATVRGNSCCGRFRLLLRSSPRFAKGSMAACRHHIRSVHWLLQALKHVLVGITGAPQCLVLAGHGAWEQLLQALQVVAAVVPALRKRQTGCVQACPSRQSLLSQRRAAWAGNGSCHHDSKLQASWQDDTGLHERAPAPHNMT